MLRSLMIKDFAIIDELQLDFDDQMTILTGETGAGKSIIIDAIGLLLGQRASSFMVKNGANKAIIEGVFDIADEPSLSKKLNELGFDVDDELVIYREISNSGKSSSKLNYRAVSATLLKQISNELADIHSQFETQGLLKEEQHLTLLDNFGREAIQPILTQYQEAYKSYAALKKEYETLSNHDQQEEERDFIQAKIDEIDEADLTNCDIDALELEKKQMASFEKTNEKLTEVLYAFNDSRGCMDSFYEANHLFSSIDDEQLEPLQERLSNLYYQLEDIISEIESYKNNLYFDKYRFETITNQLFAIKKLQKQYGYDIDTILSKRQEMMDFIDFIDHRQERLDKLKKDLDQAYALAYQYAEILHQTRLKQASLLESLMMTQLKDLYMENTIFKVEVITIDGLNHDGMDHITFKISTNKGQSLSRLQDIASGGELSRIMLAMKCIFVRSQNLPTVIFDEVDTGVSGKVAFAIGRKMKLLSSETQVLCITHLPQVACFANHHLYVYKYNDHDITKTAAYYLDKQARIEEIAKMLSNDTLTAEAINNAEALINQASNETL